MKTNIDPATNIRRWTVAEIPSGHPADATELEVQVGYTGDSNCANAIPLDTYVVPLFKLAPRLLEVVNRRVMHDLATMHLTKEEIAEVKRLSGDLSIKRP